IHSVEIFFQTYVRATRVKIVLHPLLALLLYSNGIMASERIEKDITKVRSHPNMIRL
ncbi:hypothetical protein Bhyg_10151, partial [Pseudolycoriella hygida]